MCRHSSYCNPGECRSPLVRVEDANNYSGRRWGQCKTYRDWAEAREEEKKVGSKRKKRF